MFLSLHRPLALMLILTLLLGLGGASSRGMGHRIGLAAPGLAGLPGLVGGPDGRHDVCISPSSEPASASAPGGPAPATHLHELCPDCLPRLAAAPPPHLPDVLSAGDVLAQGAERGRSAPVPAGPRVDAHGPRAPPITTI